MSYIKVSNQIEEASFKKIQEINYLLTSKSLKLNSPPIATNPSPFTLGFTK